ncbi:hypothetical protein [Shewanella sp. HL-SH2]|uniref:hypothetical protein n=1 Tax=Shewanella sp. HL-SH2 TaxID=3436238 RepID=UPI003EB86272
MTDTNATKLPYASLAAASLSSFAVGAVQLFFPDDAATRGILSSGVPLCVGAIVYIAHWCFIRWGLKPIAVMRSETNLDDLIQFYEQQISRAQQANRETTTLEAKLTDSIIARGKLFEDEASRK